MPRKSKKSLAATKREKKKAESRSNQLDTQVLSNNNSESDREDRTEGYQSDDQVLEESAGGDDQIGVGSDTDEPEVEIDGTKETLYDHLYRNQLNENRAGKRARPESDLVGTTPGDAVSLVKSGVGQTPTKRAKIGENQSNTRGKYTGDSRTTEWRNRKHVQRCASDIRSFFPSLKSQTGAGATSPEVAVLESRADSDSTIEFVGIAPDAA
ncbi:hypothetical protein FRC12_007065 [Ceratobasidium sp. 428]|nr:hypothetical protein FRC12_007065 [Ceratobasidium sp. 428]